jgi:uncharacterized membrane protein
MATLTIFLARLIGLFLLLVGVSMIAHKPEMVAIVAALADDHALLLMFGMLALIVGLAIVLSHNVWSGGVLPVVVTLFGWFMLLRGVFLLFLLPVATVTLLEALHFAEWFYLYAAIPLILGAYLTYAGFAPSRR